MSSVHINFTAWDVVERRANACGTGREPGLESSLPLPHCINTTAVKSAKSSEPEAAVSKVFLLGGV